MFTLGAGVLRSHVRVPSDPSMTQAETILFETRKELHQVIAI